MVVEVLAMIGRSVAVAVEWFEKSVTAMGAFDMVLVSIVVGMVGRRLLKPVFGSAGSDTAKKRQKGSEEE